MTRQLSLFVFFFYMLSLLSAQAQLTYYSADSFKLLGKASDETETLYERLPLRLKEISREPVWNLGKNTAGLAVRFLTDAQTIGVRWTLLHGNVMNHMAATGSNGLDLYCFENGQWTFVNSARPRIGEKENETVIVNHMIGNKREYMLFLPLYDGVTSLEIGVNAEAKIEPPLLDLPSSRKPIVAYGTSILQGGCASRAGMAHTNILTRWLNREVINLGFSGNGKLDLEIAELIAEVDASVFILDFVPNASVELIQDRLERFYSIIRKKHPQTPILFVEGPIYPHSRFDLKVSEEIALKNRALQEVFSRIASVDKQVQLISSVPMIGEDGEATVDGVHFTDLGFLRYAEYLYPMLKELLEK